jgi:hypothetical protein
VLVDANFLTGFFISPTPEVPFGLPRLLRFS